MSGGGARVTRLLRYLWALPNTALGMLVVGLSLASGGRVKRCRGCVEVEGGFARWLLDHRWFRAAALTLGHVILGRDDRCLDRCRDHEHGHVRQAERWGPFFLPAYALASLWAVLRGGHYYRDNWFEVDAERWARGEEP